MAVFVPDDGETMAAIADAVETEVVPLVLRHEGVHHDAAVGLGTEAADAGNHQVVEGGVVIVAAALTVAHEPGTIDLVKIFTDIGASAMVLTLDI